LYEYTGLELGALYSNIIGSLGFFIVISYLYWQERRSYLKSWAYFWALSAASFILAAVFSLDYTSFSLFFYNLIIILAAFFLLKGSINFTDHRVCQRWKVLGLAAFIFLVIGSYLEIWAVSFIASLTYLSLAYLVTGALLLKDPGNFITRLTGGAAAGFGIITLFYPYIYQADWFSPQGMIISGLLATLFGLGLIAMHFEVLFSNLKEVKARYQNLVETQESLICRFKPDTTLTFVNKACSEAFGLPKDELLGKKLIELIPEEHQELILTRLAEVEKQNGPLTYEHKVIEKSGGVLYQRWTNYPVHDKDGNIKEFQAVGVDISEIKAVEDRLKKQNYKIKKLHELAFELKEISSTAKVCQKTVEAAENVLEFQFCNIRLVEDDRLVNKAVSSKTDVELKPRPLSENSISRRTYQEGESIIVDNIENSPDADPVASSYRSGISIPIGNHGVFQAISSEQGAYTREELELAELLISHTTAALDRINYQEELEYETFHDSLTGLYNRKFVEKEIERLDTGRQLPISIIMIDVNGLKIINDAFGHRKGDELIKKVADILRSSLRHEDIIARWGGDEFLILLPQTGRDETRELINRLKHNCAATMGDELPISLGIGTAIKENPGQDIAGIVDKADNIMYKDKLTANKGSENRLLASLLGTLYDKSNETEEHTTRLAEIADKFGRKLGLSEEQLYNLSLLADLHDIGKVTIPEAVLLNPEELSESDWELIRRHPQKGAQIAASTEEFAHIARDIMSHHERWDGRGYPRGLKGEEIPLLARIIAIVDAYDVMTHDSSYKPAIGHEEALRELEDCAGTRYDPELVEEFVGIMRDN